MMAPTVTPDPILLFAYGSLREGERDQRHQELPEVHHDRPCRGKVGGGQEEAATPRSGADSSSAGSPKNCVAPWFSSTRSWRWIAPIDAIETWP